MVKIQIFGTFAVGLAIFLLVDCYQGANELYPSDFVTKVKKNCLHLNKNVYSPECPFGNYNFNESLAEFPCHSMAIGFQFQPNRLIYISDTEQIFAMTGLSRLTWKSHCENVTAVRGILSIGQGDFWEPTIFHMNSNVDYAMSSLAKRRFIGSILPTLGPIEFQIQRLGLYESHCELDLIDFPFDTQNCSIQLALEENPFVYQLSILPSNKLNDYVPQSFVWQLEDSDQFCRINFIYGFKRWICTSWFVFKRKPDYYVINLMLPCLFFSLLQLFAFALNVKGPDRSSLALTIVLAITLLKSDILHAIPKNSDYSFLAQYTDACSILSWCLTVYFLLLNVSFLPKNSSLGQKITKLQFNFLAYFDRFIFLLFLSVTTFLNLKALLKYLVFFS